MTSTPLRQMLNKVPEITLYFWIIKVLCTTVGETFADFLNTGLGLGLTGTSLVMGVLLAIVLAFQFRSSKYIPTIYWLSVVVISVFGTLVTDNLLDNFGVSLATTTTIFALALAATFIAWYSQEKTLSIHSIVTSKRESFYWLAIFFTFALGTAAGDLVAERLSVGYFNSILMFGGLIVLVALVHFIAQKSASAASRYAATGAVWTFWIAYILTRPLGASMGDYLSQDADAGGLALGTTVTSAIFLAAILALVAYLSVTKKDRIESRV